MTPRHQVTKKLFLNDKFFTKYPKSISCFNTNNRYDLKINIKKSDILINEYDKQLNHQFFIVMLKYRIIQNIADLENYQSVYGELTKGVKLPMDYLNHSSVFVLYQKNQPDFWLGGFVLNTEPNFRYLDFIPKNQISTLMNEHNIQENDLIEIVGIWLRPTKNIFWIRLYFYYQMLRKTFAQNKKIILGGAVKKKIQDFQMQLMKHILYEGATWLIDRELDIKIYYVKRSEFASNVVYWMLKTLIIYILKFIKINPKNC